MGLDHGEFSPERVCRLQSAGEEGEQREDQ